MICEIIVKTIFLKINRLKPEICFLCSGKDSSSEDIQSSLLKLANNIQTLSSHCSVWSNMYIKIQRQSPVLQDITCNLKQQVKLMGNHMVMFFQGWGNDIDSLICESGSKVIDSVLIVCKLTGEMALAVDMDMLCLEQMNCEEYDKNEVCHFCFDCFSV